MSTSFSLLATLCLAGVLNGIPATEIEPADAMYDPQRQKEVLHPPLSPQVPLRRRMSTNSQLFTRGPWGAANEPSNIVGTFWLQEKPDGPRFSVNELKDILGQRALRFERLRSLLVTTATDLREWQPLTDEEIDLDLHVSTTTIPRKSLIKHLVGERLRHRWDEGLLPWRAVLVRVDEDPSVCCVIIDLHHGVGDGLSCVRVLFDMLTLDAEGMRKLPPMMDMKNMKAKPNRRKAGLIAVQQAVVSHILILLAVFAGLWRTILNAVWIADTPNGLRSSHFPVIQKLQNKLAIEYLPDVSLDAIKQIKNAYGNKATINDVMVAALAGAYRRLLIERGNPTLTANSLTEDNKDMVFRAFCPFSFPRPIGPDDTELHNGFAFVTLDVPVGVSGAPSRRVAAVQETTTKMKKGLDPVVMKGLQLVGAVLLGYEFVSLVALQLNLRHSILFTNVPGPKEPAYLCGREVISMMPTVSGAGSSWTLLSYAGKVHMSFNYEKKLYGDNPERVGELFIEELERMQEEVNLPTMRLLV
ncbi:hypothetical protein BJ741DRAFT_588848 [Chytriomyces cf. hyalinus JEL632]|nr:hypothetical protein BJ741DRAFT_588848 [Chytriomyces cf. hyalinus JEL632]